MLQRVPSGKHTLIARTRDGAEATAEIAVPGAVLDLTVGAREARREEGRLTEWATARCPNGCPRPSGARVPAAEILGR